MVQSGSSAEIAGELARIEQAGWRQCRVTAGWADRPLRRFKPPGGAAAANLILERPWRGDGRCSLSQFSGCRGTKPSLPAAFS